MNICKVVLSGLLIASYVSANNQGIYSSEFEALKKAPGARLLFNQERSGGSNTDQCNIDAYRQSLHNDPSQLFFAKMDLIRRDLSLGNLQRKIMMFKELSFFRLLLQIGLSENNSDLMLVTSEAMPALYNYVDVISKETGVSTPVVFVSLKKDFFKSFSRKILGFTGSIVVGQELLQNLSDEELEAVIAQEIGHIKYNHSNKNYLLQATVLGSLVCLVLKDVLFKIKDLDSEAVKLQSAGFGTSLLSNKLVSMFAVPALVSLLVSKRFAKHADLFASKVGKSSGLISLYERLEARDQLRSEDFDAISDSLQENAADISLIMYYGLLVHYYTAKAEHCVAGIYNKFAYPSHQERIEAAKAYLQQQA